MLYSQNLVRCSCIKMKNQQKLFVLCLIIAFLVFFIHLTKLNEKIHIRLDTRIEINESEILQYISQEMQYLPVEDLSNIGYRNRNLNQSCAWYPSWLDVQIHNDYWQEFHNTNISYYIYGAYLDKRPMVVNDEPTVRILTMIHLMSRHDRDYPKTYCQFWYKEQPQPIIMPAKELHRLWVYEWGHEKQDNYGHFINCALPKAHSDWIPETVSLVSEPCAKASNNVRVTYIPLKENEVKQGFAVCIKGLDFPYIDISQRLVEYIETMRSLGAGKITVYKLQVHSNVTKVLKYYEQTGFLEYRPFSLSLEVGNLPAYRHMDLKLSGYSALKHEVIPYNDCLYRNMYHYEYVTNIDIDELPMPLGYFSNWYDLMEFAENIPVDNCKKFASYCFRCTYFPPYAKKPRYTTAIAEYFYMLQHVERIAEHSQPGWYTKCMHITDHVIATHNHLALVWSPDVCYSYTFNVSHAQLQHYREPVEKLPVDTLHNTVIDKSLWRFKDAIIERAMHVFEDLQNLQKDLK